MEQYNVKKCEMCVCNNCEEVKDMGIECLTNNMLQSPEGRELTRRQRWSSFAWSDADRFEKFFGPDANNFWHGPYQAREIAIPFIEAQNTYGHFKINEADARLLVTLNCVHDIQEATAGDTPLPDKTAEGNAYELELQRDILSRVLNLMHYDPFLMRLQEVQSGSGFLSKAFEAIEYAGYLNTGLRAWAGKDNQALEPDERAKCFELGHAVLTKNVPRMISMKEFPYIQALIAQNWPAILEARNASSV